MTKKQPNIRKRSTEIRRLLSSPIAFGMFLPAGLILQQLLIFARDGEVLNSIVIITIFILLSGFILYRWILKNVTFRRYRYNTETEEDIEMWSSSQARFVEILSYSLILVMLVLRTFLVL